MTTITIYRNKRNRNKYLEVRNDGHYHNTVRQYIMWETKSKKGKLLTSQIKNYTGDGYLHRWKICHLKMLLEDYVEVEKRYRKER